MTTFDAILQRLYPWTFRINLKLINQRGLKIRTFIPILSEILRLQGSKYGKVFYHSLPQITLTIIPWTSILDIFIRKQITRSHRAVFMGRANFIPKLPLPSSDHQLSYHGLHYGKFSSERHWNGNHINIRIFFSYITPIYMCSFAVERRSNCLGFKKVQIFFFEKLYP